MDITKNSNKDSAQSQGQDERKNVAKILKRLGNVRRLMASVLYLSDREVMNQFLIKLMN